MSRAVLSGTRVDTAMLIICCVLALLLSVLPINIRDAIAGSLRRTVVAPLITLQQQAERGRTAFLSREATTTKVDSLTLRAMQLAELENENHRLRNLLGLGRQLEWGFVAAEALHTGGLGEEFTLVLTAGSKAGVTPNTPVLASEGLVGMVRTVDPNVSLAIMWTHPDFRASAQSSDGNAYGIVSAHLGGEPERYLLELRGVAFRNALKPGTLIVTSGLGGVYPRGIPIGTVLSELRTAEGWARTYLVRPVVSPDIASVMILRPERVGTNDLSRVWAT